MANLSKSNVSSGNTIQATDVSNLYDTLTGTTAYDNIGFAKFTHLNGGGTFGDSGYGLRSSGGSIQCKNSGGAWTSMQWQTHAASSGGTYVSGAISYQV